MKGFASVVLLLLLASTAAADSKSVVIANDRTVRYETPAGWLGFHKVLPPSSPGQMIKVEHPGGHTQVQAMIVAVKAGSPLATSQDAWRDLAAIHQQECAQYRAGAVAPLAEPRTVKQPNLRGYLSSFTDAQYGDKPVPAGEFRHVTRATYLLGESRDGILVSVVILSNELDGPDYGAALSLANSFTR